MIGLESGNLINERLEARQYIEGNNLNKRCVYHICYIMAKYYRDDGLGHEAIRERLKEWEGKYGYCFEFDVNKVIYNVMDSRTPLRGDVPGFINTTDIEEIRKRFDSKNTRLLALALLAYGKACANKYGDCNVSLLGVANWLHVDYSNLVNRSFKELIDFGYIARVDTKKKWIKSSRNQVTRIHFNVPLVNTGDNRVMDNNIVRIFNEYF